MLNERRTQTRHRVNVPLEIDGGARIGLSLDASSEGMLFNTRSHFSPGEELTVTLRLPGEARAETRARVVRVTHVDKLSTLPWRYLTAVRFEGPVVELDMHLRSLLLPPG